MSLSEIVSSLGLGVWAVGALLLFFAVFISVGWRTMARYSGGRAHAAASAALDEAVRILPEDRS